MEWFDFVGHRKKSCIFTILEPETHFDHESTSIYLKYRMSEFDPIDTNRDINNIRITDFSEPHLPDHWTNKPYTKLT